MSTIKRVVFIVYSPLTSYEDETFQLQFLRSQGFEVLVLDLTFLYNPDLIVKNTSNHGLVGGYLKSISSYEFLELYLKKFAGTSVFIDCILGPSPMMLKIEKLFRLLKKYKVQYVVFSAGGIPFTNSPFNVLSLLNRIKKVLNLYKVVNYIFPKIAVFLARNGLIYPVPAMLFGTSSESFNRCISNYRIDLNKSVLTHSFDYDRFLDYQCRLNKHEIILNNTCVFLDEAITHHPDFAILGGIPFDPTPYSISMNKFFDWIENNFGLHVIIAAHPKSKYNEMPNPFNGRTIVKDNTIELVSKSSFVVVHASTSVNFAVLYNKPIVFAKTKCIQEDFDFNRRIDCWAQSLGLSAVNIDTDKLDSQTIIQAVNLDKYTNYMYKYIKTKGVEDKPFWEIFSSKIKNTYWNQ